MRKKTGMQTGGKKTFLSLQQTTEKGRTIPKNERHLAGTEQKQRKRAHERRFSEPKINIYLNLYFIFHLVDINDS